MTTHIIMITDMSGSMSQVATDVRGGFNTYIAGLAPSTECRVTAVVFDNIVEDFCTDAAPGDVPEMTTDNYRPRGSTALYDGIGKALTAFDARIPTLPDGDKVMVVIQTDGQENASQEWKKAGVKALITEREKTGVWSFTYIGMGFDGWAEAAGLGMNRGSYVQHTNSPLDNSNTYTGLWRGTELYAAAEPGTGGEAIVAASIREALNED